MCARCGTVAVTRAGCLACGHGAPEPWPDYPRMAEAPEALAGKREQYYARRTGARPYGGAMKPAQSTNRPWSRTDGRRRRWANSQTDVDRERRAALAEARRSEAVRRRLERDRQEREAEAQRTREAEAARRRELPHLTWESAVRHARAMVGLGFVAEPAIFDGYPIVIVEASTVRIRIPLESFRAGPVALARRLVAEPSLEWPAELVELRDVPL